MARPQTRLEERWNATTHGVMAILILIALPFVWMFILSRNSAQALAQSALTTVFCLCLLLMFSASALYHRLPQESRYKERFKQLDHIAIYFAIAGSYTPVALLVIGGRRGTVLLAVEWALLLLGILFKLLVHRRNRLVEVLSVGLYLAMGWIVAFAFPHLAAVSNPFFLGLIIAGGLAYTIGIVFYAMHIRFAHVVWHFFVNIGAICHFLAIVFFI